MHLGTVAHVWQEGFEPSGVAVLGDDLVVAGGAHVLAVVSDWADPTPTVTYRTLTLPEGLESEAVATQDGRLFIAGTPGRRDWYANMVADPAFTFHFKQSLQRDISARATAITDPAARREIIGRMRDLEPRMHRTELDEWVKGAPLVEVELLSAG